MNSQPPSLTFQHHFFHEFRTPIENKHTRLVEKGLSRINETSPASETNPAAFVKMAEENPKISGPNYLRRNGRVRSTRGQANETCELYKSNPSRVTRGGLSRDQYVSCPKLASLD